MSRRVLVIGLGKVTGEAAARALAAAGARVTVSEIHQSADHERTAARLAPLGVRTIFGQHSEALLEDADLVVPAPGVTPRNPLVGGALARGIPVWSEVELGYRLAGSRRILGVTGTNGKTTTTALLAEMLRTAGMTAVAAGNIGEPLVAAAVSSPADAILVAELSSAQLALIDQLHARVAIVLNVAEDHYDWHGGYDEYVAAKGRITERQSSEDLLIIRDGDAGGMSIASGSSASIGGFGLDRPDEVSASLQQGLAKGAAGSAGLEGGDLVIVVGGDRHLLLNRRDIRLAGEHNIENVLAAALAAIWLKADPSAVAAAVKAFEGFPHRKAVVRVLDGVTYVNDSKATNPHATLAALRGMSDVVLIAGGRAKGLDLSVLEDAKSSLRAAVLIGEAAGEIEQILAGVEVRRAEDLSAAVRAARDLAAPGSTVMLSPACASFDQFESYAQRGEAFEAEVSKL